MVHISIGFQYLRVQTIHTLAFFERLIVPIAVGGLTGARRLRHPFTRSRAHVVLHRDMIPQRCGKKQTRPSNKLRADSFLYRLFRSASIP